MYLKVIYFELGSTNVCEILTLHPRKNKYYVMKGNLSESIRSSADVQ
jgi:hypothetical protein